MKKVTTKYFKTTAIPLYKIGGETYCKMIDVVRLIHHEFFETEDKGVRDILDRMEMRLTKNDFLLPDAQKPTVLGDATVPGRYAVGRFLDGKWQFYTESGEFSDRPCKAKLYVNCRDASACADFLDGEWDVLDFYDNLPEETRWLRDLRMPYDADEGLENTIPAQIVT